eukprot:7034736-Pyramimonas_sp.AAC.1
MQRQTRRSRVAFCSGSMQGAGGAALLAAARLSRIRRTSYAAGVVGRASTSPPCPLPSSACSSSACAERGR